MKGSQKVNGKKNIQGRERLTEGNCAYMKEVVIKLDDQYSTLVGKIFPHKLDCIFSGTGTIFFH